MDPTILLSLVVFVGAIAFVLFIGGLMKDMGTSKTEDRLAIMTGQKSAEDAATKKELLRETADGVHNSIGRWFAKIGDFPKLFEQAESPISMDKFFLISGVCLGLGAAIGIITRIPPAAIPIFAIFIGLCPLFWLLFRRRSRFKKFAKQLPDAMELVGRALRSGHSLASGLHVVVEEMPAPISTEFGKAYEEQNLGIPIEQALKNMLTRVPNLDLKFFVTAVAIQRQAGGDLAEILDKISYIIRERFKIMGQVAALTGEGRISGIVLMGLPIVLFFAVYYLNPDYVMLLFTEELGRKMIAFGIVMQILGAVCIKKIVNIKI